MPNPPPTPILAATIRGKAKQPRTNRDHLIAALAVTQKELREARLTLMDIRDIANTRNRFGQRGAALESIAVLVSPHFS